MSTRAGTSTYFTWHILQMKKAAKTCANKK